jgi:ankyrin repeat protein
MLSAENGRLDVVQKLLEKGADIRALNEDKLTPLDMAEDGETKDFLRSIAIAMIKMKEEDNTINDWKNQ